MLKQDGRIKALLGMFQTGHNDVIAQIARGIANFAKCESRAIRQGLILLCSSEMPSWFVLI
jgi:kinesin family member 5